MKIFNKNINKEIIKYGIAGVMTTLVNYLTYFLMCNVLEISNLNSNAIAWIVAIIFAYIVNNGVVFKSSYINIKKETIKIIKFFLARLASFAFEQFGMFIFIDFLKLNNLIIKAVLNIVVIIINYFFSKLYIFNKKYEIKESQ